MGSKSDIVENIMRLLPKSENFYDLFGGGFAVTHAAILFKKAKTYHFNEIKPDTVDLIQRAIRGEFSYSNFKPPWVSREEFFARKDTDAYVRLFWSFGNDQKYYLFGEDIEPYKKSLHMAVVFDEFDDIAIKALGFKAWPFGVKSINKRRLVVRYLVKKMNPKLKPTQLQQLQQLQQLERLEQLERLQANILWTSKDYREIEIKNDSVVYCDPPYAGTADYDNESAFNHKEFWDWARLVRQPMFVSEYTVPSDFRVVGKYHRKTKMSQKGMTKTKPELLVCNQIAYDLCFKPKT